MYFKKYLLLLTILSLCFSQFNWENNGLPVRQAGHIEWQRSGAVGHNNEMIFVWSDTRYGVRDIFAQKVDSDGNLLWGTNGNPVVIAPGRQEDPITVSDENGGAYVVWVDYDAEPDIGDIYAQHILSDGTLAWNSRGIALSNLPGKQLTPNICKDGQGGAYVIWDDRSEYPLGEIYATHLSLDGAILNPGTGVLIMNHFATMQAGRSGISLETGGNGEAVLGWADDRDTQSYYNIYTQRIDLSCNTLYSTISEGGKIVCSVGSAEVLSRHPRITYVNENITAMVWEDYRNGPYSDVYMQFLDTNGDSILDNNGIAVSTADGPQYLPRIKADDSSAYIIWEDLRNHPVNSDIYAQKYDLNGISLLEDNGHPLSVESGKQYGSRLTIDGEGGAYFVWSDERNGSYPEVEVFLQHIDANNQMSFIENGISISEAPYVQENPLVRKDGNGGAFIVWGDYRTGSVGIFGQHVVPGSEVTFQIDGIDLYIDIDGDVMKGTHGAVYLGNDKTLVYWQDNRWNPFSIETYGKIIDNDYASELYENGISLSSNVLQESPQIAKVGSNLFLLFESYNEEELEHLYLQVLDMDLNPLNDPNGQHIYDNITPQIKPKMIVNGNDLYLAYSDLRDWVSYDVVVQKFNANGNPQWDEAGITINLDNDDIVSSIVPLSNGGCVVFWRGGNISDLNIYYKAFDSDGNTPEGWSESPQLLSNAISTQKDPITINYGDGIFVVWEDYQSGNADLYGQFIDSNGSILEVENGFSIANENTDEYNAQVAYNNTTNTILVVWEYNNGIDFDIQSRIIDISTLSIQETFNVVNEFSDQTDPTLFSSNGDKFLMMWRDGRATLSGDPPAYDIYYQELGINGFYYEMGGISVCDFSYNQDNPRIELLSESENSYLLYWNDMRSTGKQDLVNLYTQSVTVVNNECTLMDVNSDSSIDILDIVSLVNIILENIIPTSEQECASDVNQDNSIDVIDIVTVVNYVLDS